MKVAPTLQFHRRPSNLFEMNKFPLERYMPLVSPQ